MALLDFWKPPAFSQGSVLNVSAVAREAMVERKVVENYFTILEDLLTAVRIPVFPKSQTETDNAHQILFLTPEFIKPSDQRAIDRPEEIYGVALESLFLQNLWAVNDYLNLGYKIYYYHTTLGTEVDFILYGERGIVAFEIKRSAKYSRSDLRGLKAFLADYPAAKGILIYGGTRKMYEGKIKVIPISEALKTLADLL